jgi:inosose dehydratase
MDGAVSLRLATGPVSWGVDFADAPGNPPWHQVLDGIAAAGFAGLELGPVGYLPEDPGRLREELAARGLDAVGTFVFEPLHVPERLEQTLAAGRRAATLVAGVGGSHLIAIDLVSPERARAAGRSAEAPRLDARGHAVVHRALRGLAAIAADAGLVLAFHPHAGSYVEFADEIRWIAGLAPVCLDTGHAAYAGLDPVALARELGERVVLLHLKDLDADVHGRVLERRLGFWDAVGGGVFCPLGRGAVDLRGVLDAVPAREWATVEQDRVPGGDPVADLRESLAALVQAGVP